MSKKILGSFFKYNSTHVVPHGITYKGYSKPLTVRPIDLTDMNDRDRVDTMRERASRIGRKKFINVDWCVYEVEHTNTNGTMIIDPTGHSYRVGQNAYRYVPSYEDIVAGKIVSIERHKHLYNESCIANYDCELSIDFWIIRFMAARGKNIKSLWVDDNDAEIINSDDTFLFTNKRDILKIYRDIISPTSSVRIGYGNAQMGLRA